MMFIKALCCSMMFFVLIGWVGIRLRTRRRR
jgi:hypothetical protein